MFNLDAHFQVYGRLVISSLFENLTSQISRHNSFSYNLLLFSETSNKPPSRLIIPISICAINNATRLLIRDHKKHSVEVHNHIEEYVGQSKI